MSDSFTAYNYAPPPVYSPESTNYPGLYPNLYSQPAPSAPPESDSSYERPPAYNPAYDDGIYNEASDSSDDTVGTSSDEEGGWSFASLFSGRETSKAEPAPLQEVEVTVRPVGDEVSVGYLQQKVTGYALGTLGMATAAAFCGMGAISVATARSDFEIVAGLAGLVAGGVLWANSAKAFRDADQLTNSGYFVQERIKDIDVDLHEIDTRILALQARFRELSQDKAQCKTAYDALEADVTTVSNLTARKLVEEDLEVVAQNVTRFKTDLRGVRI